MATMRVSPQVSEFQTFTKEFLLGPNMEPQQGSNKSHFDFVQVQNNPVSSISSMPPLSHSSLNLDGGVFSSGVFAGNNGLSALKFPSALKYPSESFSTRTIPLPNAAPQALNKTTNVAPKVKREPSHNADSSSAAIVLQRKLKRPMSKREPLPEEFTDEEEYNTVWSKWREDRDHNNRSVKRSRQRSKQKKLETLKSSSGGNNSDNDELIQNCKHDLKLLVMLHKGRRMSDAQVKRATLLLDLYDTDGSSSPDTHKPRGTHKWKSSTTGKTSVSNSSRTKANGNMRTRSHHT